MAAYAAHTGRVIDGVNGVASNASYTSEVIDCSKWATIWFQIDLDDASDPDYSVAVWSGLATDALGIIPLTVGNITATAGSATIAGVTLSANGTIDVVGATLVADARILFSVQNIGRYAQLVMTRSGGGTTGSRVTARYWQCDPR